ncbi:MAG TPA: Sec-independent protein translocase subunit TatA [Lapillicoccus sp.]|nr:Sec-independent protein translocase subunit TatA [Lapillicoccus sp.]
MWRDLLQPSHLIIVAVLLVILFGWKKLPDAARSVGRSMRIFKSEVGEMKNDGKQTRPSAAAEDVVPGDVVPPQTAQPTAPAPPAAQPAAQPAAPTVAQPQAAAPQPTPVYQQTPARNGQSAEDATAEQQRHENPAL